MEKKLLTKEQILKSNDLATEIVEVPEWGGSVIVTTLTGMEREELEDRHGKSKDSDRPFDIRARVCASSIVDTAGNRLFTEADVIALSGKSAAPLIRIFDVAQKLSGLSDAAIEDLAKNSETTQIDDSISD